MILAGPFFLGPLRCYFHGLGKKTKSPSLNHIQPTEHTSITQKPGFTTAFLLRFDPSSVKSERKGLWKLSWWTKMMLNPESSEVTQKRCLAMENVSPNQLPVLPASASPYLWEIRIHVLGCDWWIRDKFKELPHSHHGNAMLKKEICQRRCLWGLCEGKGCYSNLFTDRQIKFTITEPRASVSLSQTIRCHGSLPTA